MPTNTLLCAKITPWVPQLFVGAKITPIGAKQILCWCCVLRLCGKYCANNYPLGAKFNRWGAKNHPSLGAKITPLGANNYPFGRQHTPWP